MGSSDSNHHFDLCAAAERDGLAPTLARATVDSTTTLYFGVGGGTDSLAMAAMAMYYMFESMFLPLTPEQRRKKAVVIFGSASGSKDGDFAVFDDARDSAEPPPRGADGRYAADRMFEAGGMDAVHRAKAVELRKRFPDLGRIVVITATWNKGPDGKFAPEYVDRAAADLERLLRDLGIEPSTLLSVGLDQGADCLLDLLAMRNDAGCSVGRDGLTLQVVARCSPRMLPLVTAPGIDGCADFTRSPAAPPAAGATEYFLVGEEGQTLPVHPIGPTAARRLPAAPPPPEGWASVAELLPVADARALVDAVGAALATFAVAPPSTPATLVRMQAAADLLGPGHEGATLVSAHGRKREGTHARVRVGDPLVWAVRVAPDLLPRGGP